MKRFLTPLAIIVAALLLGSIGRQIILGGAAPVHLASASSLTGLVAQNLSGNTSSSVAVVGKDFNLRNVRYFSHNDWVVLEAQPLQNKFNLSFLVLEKINGSYEVVLGPGSAFDSSYLLSVPPDVGSYLKAKGVIYDTVD